MAEYRITLGVDVDVSGVQAQLNNIKPNPIKLDIDTNYINSQIGQIKSQIQSLNNLKINLGATSSGGRGRSGISSGVNEANKAYGDLMNLARRINSIRFEISGLDASKNSGQITELSGQLNELMATYNSLKSRFTEGLNFNQLSILKNEIKSVTAELDELRSSEKTMSQQGFDTSAIKSNIETLESKLRNLKSVFNELGSGLTIDQVDSLDNVFETTTAKIEVLKAKIADMKAELARGINQKLADSTFDKQIVNAETSIKKLANVSGEVQTAMAEVKLALTDMQTASAEGDIERLIDANKRYEQALKSLNNQLGINAKTEQQAYGADNLALDKEKALLRLEGLFEKGSQAAKRYGAEVQRLQSEISECANDAGMKNINKQISNLEKNIKNSGLQTQTLGGKIKAQFQKYSQYFSVASMIMYATQGLKDMFNQVVAIDSAMTELKKVTNETDASYDKFLGNAASRAKEIGTTIDGLVSSTADFARLGYSFEESAGLAEVANIYTVVGDEIDGVETATQSLVSTLAAFKHEMGDMSDSDFAMSIVDKFNEVSNNFAISSGGIGEALQRSASSLAAANNTLDESIALITAANTVVQNPEKVGNAFKTISMRIRGAKTELEAAGESTEGMAESTASLRQEIYALSGVDIMKNANEFKSTYEIMDELADKWEGLSDIAQASITELIAGKHQGNVMSSLMANFDIARDALETSQNSAGSAMAEHAKWSDSLEARLNKLKATWQSLSQTFLKSDFLKGGISALTGFVDALDKIIDKTGVIMPLLTAFAGKKIFSKIFDAAKMTQFAGGMRSIGDVVSVLTNAFPKLTSVVSSFFKGGLSAGFSAILGLFNPVTAAITAVVAGVAAIGAIAYKQKKEVAELAEKVDEVTTSYKEQSATLKKLKGDYDTSNEDSMISKYGELSKGVNELGENISLTADEYSEYQNIVSQIADTNPDLVTGYNSQGNAILKCAGDVDALAESYKELIKAENEKVTSAGADVLKDFRNDLKDTSAYYETQKKKDNGGIAAGKVGHFDTKHLDKLEELMNLSGEQLDSAIDNLTMAEIDRLSNLLEEQGIERNKLGSGDAGWENKREHVVRALNKDKAEIKAVLDGATADLNAYAEEMGTVAEAYLSTAFLGGDSKGIGNYAHLSERMQNAISQAMSGLGTDFYSQFIDDTKTDAENYAAVTKEYNKILSAFNSMSDTDAAQFETAFDLKTQFNGGEISYGEYVNGLQEAGQIVDKLGLNEEVETQIKLSLGLNEDGLVDQYQTLMNRLTNKEESPTGNIIGLEKDDAQKLLNSLSSKELSVLTKIIPEIDANATREQIEAAIDREMVLSGLIFDLNLEVEAAGIESLNTALAESVTASGLSSESISALKSRYADLEAQGYDLSSMFEETSHGIHVNRNEISKFENELSKQKLEEVNGDLAKMKSEYDKLGEAIKNCDDSSKKAELFNDRQNLAQKIADAATLASQYQGLTSAYNQWLAAEQSGNERDMYENVISGFETVKDELSRGWADDSTIAFLEMLTGKTDLASKSGKELKEVYDSLGKKIKDTSYSVKDFFTVDDSGNSTSKGVYNFLDAIGQLEEEAFGGKDVVKRNSKGGIIGFDFNLVGGDEAIAEALGISEELVQIMVRAADDAGFVVSMDGTYKQLADLQNEAKAAVDVINELFDKDYSFDFNTSNLESLNADLKEAKEILGKKEFWNDDGTFNFDAKGATEAMTIVSTLQAKLDTLSQEKYGIGLTVEDKQLEEPLAKLQDYGHIVATLNQLKLNPKANAAEIEKLEGNLDTIAQDLIDLSNNSDIDIGIDADDSIEDVKNKIQSGEVKIPTTLDIQTNIDKNISDLKDIALLTSGLLSEEQEQAIKIRLGIEVEGGEVDDSKLQEDIENGVHDTSAYWSENKEKVTTKADTKVEAGKVDTTPLDNTVKAQIDADNKVKTGAKGRMAYSIGNVDVEVDNVDTSDVENKTNEAVENQSGETTIEKKTNVELKAETIDDSNINGEVEELVKKEVPTGANGRKMGMGIDVELEAGDVDTTPLDNTVKSQIDQDSKHQETVEKSANIDIKAGTIDDSNLSGEIEELVKNEDAEITVTANIEGNLADGQTVDNIVQSVEKINELEGITGGNITITANIEGGITDEKIIGNLVQFTDKAKELKGLNTVDVSISAVIGENINDESISRLKRFAEAIRELPTSAVDIAVNASVDTANINSAIMLLQKVANSGLFQNYSASVTVTATPANTNLGDGFTGEGTVTMEPDKTDFGHIFTGSGVATMEPDKTDFGHIFTGSGTVTMSYSLAGVGAGGGGLATGVSSGLGGSSGAATLANGTAHANGTAFADGTAESGRAFKLGDWRTKDSGVALMGELGRELIVRDGRFFTVGDTGAGFYPYKKGDIIFNHRQTEELFKNGHVISNGGRGRTFASGTAFSSGTAFNGGSSGKGGLDIWNESFYKSGSSKPSGGSSGNDKNSDGAENKVIDWIEKLLERFDRAIDMLDKAANNIYKSFDKRNASLSDEIVKVNEQIANHKKAYDRYIAEANTLGDDIGYKIGSDYEEKIRNGDFSIDVLSDEKLVEYIEAYEEWYEKALESEEAVQELEEKLSSLYAQRVELVATKYEGILGVVEHEKSMLEEYISQSEAQAWFVSKKYYDALINNERENIVELENQKAEMLNAFNEAMNSGTIDEGSEGYYEMVASIDEVTLAIQESKTQLMEYDQTIQQLSWDIFDVLQDRISAVTEETEFLIELLSRNKLYDDNGQLTNDGSATMGLHGVAYNTYMHQADLAAEEITRLKKELEEDPFDNELEERYREMISLQQEYILSAENERDAIKSLVEEGIQLEIEALEEKIDKYNEALESEKDLHDYQKKVIKSTKEIASLEKQLAAYQGDNSEEARQKIQQIKVDLEDARAELEETEYDKLINDSQKLLDNLLIEYEETLNTRLDNIDALISDMIAEINADAGIIGDVIREAADSVGYTLTDSMKNIWDKDATSTENVVTTYGDKFVNAQTTTNNALNSINKNLQNIINKLNEKAETNSKSASTSSVVKSSGSNTTATKTTTNKSGGDGKPKIGDRVKYVSGQYYYDSQGKKPLGSHKQGEYVYITNINTKDWATHGYHISTGNKLGKGDLGWLKLNQISGYASGKKNFANDEVAWTQEDGKEFIVRPSDGAILTPIAKRDSILTASASKNIWDFANSPSEFIKDNLKLDTSNVPNNSNIQNNYTQHLDKVVFSLPNVKNYDEFLSAMQKDRNFERLIHSMTIDQIAGSSSLGKKKSIR